MGTPWENFINGVNILASTDDPLKQRLINAYCEYISLTSPAELPLDIQKKFEEIGKELTKLDSVDNKGKIQATIKAMSTARVSEIAEEFVSMFGKIASYEE